MKAPDQSIREEGGEGVLGGEMLRDPGAKGLCNSPANPGISSLFPFPNPSTTPQQLHQWCQIRPSSPRMVEQPLGSPPIPTLIHCAEGKGSLLPQLRVFLQLRGVTGQGYSGSKWHHSVSC